MTEAKRFVAIVYLATPKLTSGKSSSPFSEVRSASMTLMITWYGTFGWP